MIDPGDIRRELRELPAIETLLEAVSTEAAIPRPLLLSWAREAVGDARSAILAAAGASAPGTLPARGRAAWTEWLLSRIDESIDRRVRRVLRRVVNATGVILHTNLGRAPFSAEGQRAIWEVAGGYSNLEMDLVAGKRRSRLLPVRDLLPVVTGAEAGLAVHNNAAAVFLALSGLARDREVIVSRGHLVEIGGSFRLATIMEASGARLVEVGSTNRTRVSDYAERIGPDTALILKVHPSNFRMIGFTEEAPAPELAELAHAHGLLLFDDVGSGALDQHQELSFGEPRVQDSLRAGADLVAFSGDKLLGGPQSGMLVGRRAVVDRLAKHPLARVLRLDKTALAVLESTLEAYLDPAEARRRLPLLVMLSREPAELAEEASQLARAIRECGGESWRVEVVASESEIGGGSLPGVRLPSSSVALSADDWTPDQLARAYRSADPAVVGRIERDRLLLDLRTLLPGDAEAILEATAALTASPAER